MGIYIGHNDNSITFKALFHELELSTEGHDYEYGSIDIEVLMEKLDGYINENAAQADLYHEWMEEEGYFAYGHDDAGRKAFATGCATSAMEICHAAKKDGETTITWC